VTVIECGPEEIEPPKPPGYVHRCTGGHTWAAPFYQPQCPQCPKQCFDVRKVSP